MRRASADDPVALPCVGDWAALSELPEGRYELDVVLPRHTAFVRGGVSRDSRGGLSGDGQGQVLAANVDVVFVAEPSMHSNDYADLGRIERLVALAWESGGTPVVLVTKSDLFEQGLDELLADVRTAAPGVDVHAVSSLLGDGVELVRGYLEGARTAVVLGPSGAGKSTLVNALAGDGVMETQQVRAADGRGRHTTVHRELIPLPDGGLIIDTPGIRRVGLYEMSRGRRPGLRRHRGAGRRLPVRRLRARERARLRGTGRGGERASCPSGGCRAGASSSGRPPGWPRARTRGCARTSRASGRSSTRRCAARAATVRSAAGSPVARRRSVDCRMPRGRAKRGSAGTTGYERVFVDRVEAGELLAERLLAIRDPVVLALPRGGVEVAEPVARRLGVALDVLVTRKIGYPPQPELGVGAIAEGGEPVFDLRLLRPARSDPRGTGPRGGGRAAGAGPPGQGLPG